MIARKCQDCHCQVSSGFIRVQTMASAHVLHLPTNSVRLFQVGSNFRFWMKSKSSLHTEKQGDEARESSAFGVSFGWGMGRARFWSMVVTGAYSIVQMDYNT